MAEGFLSSSLKRLRAMMAGLSSIMMSLASPRTSTKDPKGIDSLSDNKFNFLTKQFNEHIDVSNRRNESNLDTDVSP